MSQRERIFSKEEGCNFILGDQGRIHWKSDTCVKTQKVGMSCANDWHNDFPSERKGIIQDVKEGISLSSSNISNRAGVKWVKGRQKMMTERKEKGMRGKGKALCEDSWLLSREKKDFMQGDDLIIKRIIHQMLDWEQIRGQGQKHRDQFGSWYHN